MTKLTTVHAYIISQVPEVQDMLLQLQQVIKNLCPDAVESISYGMPAYKYHGKPLIYFAAFAHHIGIYATPHAHAHFTQELAWYKQGKGSVQFPLDRALPIDVIEKMIKYNMNEIEKKE